MTLRLIILILTFWMLAPRAGAITSITNVLLAWNPVTNAASYRIHYGQTTNSMTNIVSAGTLTNLTVTGLVDGAVYYFAVTALGSSGMESPFSNVTNFFAPIPPGYILSTNVLCDRYMGVQGISSLSSNWVNTGFSFKIRDTIGVVASKPIYLVRSVDYSNVPYLTNVALVNTNNVVQSAKSTGPMPPVSR